MKCPCCSQEMPDKPVVLGDATRTVSIDGQLYKLGPTAYVMFAAMWRRRPRELTVRQIVDLVYESDPAGGPEFPEVTVRTIMWRLKQIIRDSGVHITNNGGPGATYKIDYVARPAA